MALTIVEQTEYEENGYTYIKTVYSNGTIDIHIKSDPASVEPPAPSTEPTMQDIMDELKAMQGDQVPAATLDSAYKEGVNSYV